ncbi:MAG: HTTM domain-containing protein [Flavobacteriales bacterium]|nr:HTTM domain-containing protein [Flavobacteriales bacterium]MCB9168339.1 HTTM domain-containing protein [Flavobacteriales bacterium]
MSRFLADLHRLTDARALALFRILFGVLMFYEINFYFGIHLVDMGLVGPKYLFKYEGFSWVAPLGRDTMAAILGGLAAAALMIAVGLLYRLAIVYFLLGYTYIFLIDKGYYNNHFYLFVLLSFLMSLAPASRAWSLDRVVFKRWMRRDRVPYWTWIALRAQVVIVYFFGGIAKLNADWLLHQEPMRTVLAETMKGGALADLALSTPVVAFFTYGGVLFDLLIGPLLWWKRTRKYALPFVLLFNLTNHNLFDDIGVFPFFMIAATVLFFDPEEIARWVGGRRKAAARKGRGAAAEAVETVEPRMWWPLVNALLAVYFVFQLFFPLRWLVRSGDPDWHTIAQRFSWRMKISTRLPLQVDFFVRDDDTGLKRPVQLDRFINNMQAQLCVFDPRASVQFAHWLKEEMQRRGMKNVRITAEIVISHNGRPYRYLWPTDLDLSVVRIDLDHPEDWVPDPEGGPAYALPPGKLDELRRRVQLPTAPRTAR